MIGNDRTSHNAIEEDSNKRIRKLAIIVISLTLVLLTSFNIFHLINRVWGIDPFYHVWFEITCIICLILFIRNKLKSASIIFIGSSLAAVVSAVIVLAGDPDLYRIYAPTLTILFVLVYLATGYLLNSIAVYIAAGTSIAAMLYTELSLSGGQLSNSIIYTTTMLALSAIFIVLLLNHFFALQQRAQDENVKRIRMEEIAESAGAREKTVKESSAAFNLWSVDRKMRYIFFNNYHKNEMKRQWNADIDFGMSMPDCINNPDLKNDVIDHLKKVFAGEAFETADKIVDASGKELYYQIIRSPIINKKNQIEGATIISIDITEKIEYQKQMQDSLKEKETLLKEIHHRVKNNLQIISSLLNLEQHKFSGEEFRNSQNRIQVMALLHEQLYQSGDMANISLSDYIMRLSNDLFESYSVDRSRIGLDLDIEDIEIDTDKVIVMGLIFNELVSNSLQHAFPGDQRGRICIHLKRANDRNLLFTVSDNGIGMDKAKQEIHEESLGLQLVETLADQLKGKYTRESDLGVRSDVLIPL
jgi:two-component sensor histidine kinase